MSCRIEKDAKCILVEFTGDTSLAENEKARNDLIAMMKADGIHNVLVDMTHADLSSVSIEDLIEFGEGWGDLGVSSDIRLAVLVPYGHRFRDKVDLSLWTGIRAGAQLKIFEERTSAVGWLSVDRERRITEERPLES